MRRLRRAQGSFGLYSRSIPVEAGDSFRHGAEGFPRDCVCPAAEFGDGDFFRTLPTDQNYRIAAADFVGDVGDIDDCLIHAHAPENGTAFAMDEHGAAIAAGAGDAVAVAGGELRDRALFFQYVGAVITDASAGRQIFHQADGGN